jgi:hypothetical protein
VWPSGSHWGQPQALGPAPSGSSHPITFCSASRSGLPCVNPRMGSLATFKEEACFCRSLGIRAEQRQKNQQLLLPAPSPSVSYLGSYLAQKFEIQSKYRV